MQGDTNCRSGPGTSFPILKIITAGEQVEVIGRYILDNYYFVSLTEDTNNACWVWADSSSMAVDSSVLPIVAAPPAPTATITPTPTTAPADFNLGNPWFDKCEIDAVNYYIPQFEIVNTGTIHFQSIRAVLTNETTLDTFVYEFDYFRGSENCAIDNDGEVTQLLAGDSTDMVLRGNRMLQENPGGTEFSLKVTLFAKNRQEGISVTREINFTP